MIPAIKEKHRAVVWWVIRLIEVVTCFHIIAGIWRHW